MTATQSLNQDAAMRLASMFHIFPCNPFKKPIWEAWEQSATNSALKIAAIWQGAPHLLPAIPVGAHGLLVVDCDRKPNASDGVAAFTALCAERGIALDSAFVVETPSTGLHFYWRTETPYGNSRGSLPDGVDVRGVGGYVIGPGASGYRIVQGSWDAIPTLPESLAALLRPKVDTGVPAPVGEPVAATAREKAYAEKALADEVANLADMREGSGRNAALNTAALHMGEMVGAGWIERGRVEQALRDASERNGYRAKDGDKVAWDTLQSGLNAGMAKPRSSLALAPNVAAIDVSGIVPRSEPNNKPVSQKPSKRSITLVQCSTIEAKAITWIWNGFIPQGKLTLLAGAGGTGKSTLAFSFAATVSNAEFWPDGSRCVIPGNVLIWSSEDDASDTIVPRLMAVSANLQRCGIISGAIDESGMRCPFDAARDMDQLREAAQQIGGVSLLIIDPIVTAVTGDMHKANDVRRSLQSIVDFAAEMNCAVLGITHFAKGTAGKNSAERVIGSQAFAALARMVLVAAKDEESDRRVFTRAKSNNSADTGGFSYAIEVVGLNGGITATRIDWGEPLQGSSRSILAEIEGDSDGTSQLHAAKQYLTETLSAGPAPSQELLCNARDGHGISNNTLRRAQKEIGIVATKTAFTGGWIWSLPTRGAHIQHSS